MNDVAEVPKYTSTLAVCITQDDDSVCFLDTSYGDLVIKAYPNSPETIHIPLDLVDYFCEQAQRVAASAQEEVLI